VSGTACRCEIEIGCPDLPQGAEHRSGHAKHFRQHDISDEDLPAMVDGTGLSNADYLRSRLFPDASKTPGPSVRSGHFGEILVADYIEYLLGYWSPRTLRYQDRWNRNDSTKGCDIIGFKFATDALHHPHDELVIFESKSGMTKTEANRLQDAITDSIKDHLREAMTLNAMKQRMLVRGQHEEADKVKRFQNETARPFRRINGAAAVLDDEVFAATDLTTANATGHPNVDLLRLIVIRGPSLMKLVHALYERAADEA
jgi:Cap4 SAVED domain